ncbi:MAG: hypothetical protein ABR564_06930 [Candidatus Dormibacteria bacterium]
MIDLRKLLRLASPEGVLGIAFVTLAATGAATISSMASAPVGDYSGPAPAAQSAPAPER